MKLGTGCSSWAPEPCTNNDKTDTNLNTRPAWLTKESSKGWLTQLPPSLGDKGQLHQSTEHAQCGQCHYYFFKSGIPQQLFLFWLCYIDTNCPCRLGKCSVKEYLKLLPILIQSTWALSEQPQGTRNTGKARLSLNLAKWKIQDLSKPRITTITMNNYPFELSFKYV